MMQVKHTLDPKYVFIKLYFINANFINSAEKIVLYIPRYHYTRESKQHQI